MSMTVAMLMSWPDMTDTIWVSDQIDETIVAAVGHDVFPGLVSVDEVTVAPPTPHGGYVRPQYGSITVSMEAFARAHAASLITLWPPPQVLYIDLKYWETASATIQPLAYYGQAIGYRTSMSADGATYGLYLDDSYAAVATDAVYDGTLNAVFAAAAATLGVSLVTTYARSPSPQVDYKAAGEVRILDALDAIASFFSHRFYFSSAGLVLVDMFQDNGTALTLSSDEWESVEYPSTQPFSKLVADYTQAGVSKIRLGLQTVQDAGTSTVIAEAKLIVGDTAKATAVSVSAADPSYPGRNLVDGSTSTFWGSGSGTVPGVTMDLTTTPAELNIWSYRLTATNLYFADMPTKWRLYGWHLGLSDYAYIGEVETTSWSALEARTFAVPPAHWPVEKVTTLTFGDEYTLAATCANTYPRIIDALNNIQNLTNVARDRVRLAMPISAEVIPGRNVSVIDYLTSSLSLPTWPTPGSGAITMEQYKISAWLRVDSIAYDFIAQSMVVEGEGRLA